MQEYEPIFDGALFERERDSNATLLPLLCGCAALTFTAGFGAWVLSTPPVSAPQIVVARSASDRHEITKLRLFLVSRRLVSQYIETCGFETPR